MFVPNFCSCSLFLYLSVFFWLLSAGMKKSDYRILAPLGKGGFAEVFLCKIKQTGELIAIKRIKKEKLNDKQVRSCF